MICPHCAAHLRRRDRPDRRCGKCRRNFALEPKENLTNLHDVALRGLVGRLARPDGPGPPLPVTVEQLRFAVNRRGDRRSRSGRGVAGGIAVVVAALVVLGTVPGVRPSVFVLTGLGGAVLVALGVLVRRRFARDPVDRVSRPDLDRMLATWHRVYGAPPPGLVPGAPSPVVAPSGTPRVALVCPDPDALQCLAAAGVAERHGALLLLAEVTGPPPAALRDALARSPGLPVLVLHGADVAGCAWPARLRATLPPGTRTVAGGLRPRQVMSRPAPRGPRPRPEALAALPALDDAERSWLAEGHAVALSALRPATLLRGVEAELTRATAAADPDLAHAAGLGFLDTPRPVRP